MIAYEDLIFENKEAFLSKLQEIAGKLSVNPSWLMVVFYIETAAIRYHEISSHIQNSIGATGLIQFMIDTAKGLGTTTDDLRDMSDVDQLDYVYEYLEPYSGRFDTLADLYFAVFFPIAIGKPDDWVLSARNLSPGLIARQNPMYDLDHDGQITVSEVSETVGRYLPDEFKDAA